MKSKKQKHKYIFLKTMAVGTFALAMPFFVFAEETPAALPAPTFLKNIKTKEDVAKLTPAEQKEFMDYMQQQNAGKEGVSNAIVPNLSAGQNSGTLSAAARAKGLPPLPAAAAQVKTPLLSTSTVKALIAGVPLLIVLGAILYRAWKKKKERALYYPTGE